MKAKRGIFYASFLLICNRYDLFMDFGIEIFSLILSLICLGAFAGFLAGLLGVGGGIVLVPGLYYIFSYLQPSYGFDAAHIMHICVGTSLAVIVPTGFSSARSHHKKSSVDFDLVRLIGVGIVVGVLCGTWVASFLDAKSMKIIFASAILALAGMMVLGNTGAKINAGEATPFKNVIAGYFIGCLSTLIGIGGATLSVPYMSMNNVPMRRAVGSASAMGVIIAAPASLGFVLIGWGMSNLPPFSIGYVNVLAWALIIPMSIMVAPIGARAAHKISVKKLKVIFAVFMVLVALNMWQKILMGI